MIREKDGGAFLPMQNGNATLNSKSKRFPENNEPLFSKQYRCLKVTTTGKGTLIVHYIVNNLNSGSGEVIITPDTQNGYRKFCFDLSFTAWFELDLSEPDNQLEVAFEFTDGLM